MSEFTDAVISIVRQVPYGTVASYGQIAAYTGVARAARQVGWTLNRIEGRVEVPWWRIVNNAGRISIKNTEFNTPMLMKQMLEHEGVDVASDYTFDIGKYRFRPSVTQMKSWQLDDEYIERICKKYLI
ncbi:MAG: MGMT family protein [bacterium]|nr:MGMT family protein [bacterium]